jgi:hypothetical protein
LIFGNHSLRIALYIERVDSAKGFVMRKYWVAGAIGLLLIAGQAAASDSAVVSLGDRVGAPTDTATDTTYEGSSLLLILLLGGAAAGLAAWAASSGGGSPASP